MRGCLRAVLQGGGVHPALPWPGKVCFPRGGGGHGVGGGGGGEPWRGGALCLALQAEVGVLSMGMSWCMWWSLVVV
ncbi:MAG: hypothetical protein GY820_20870 [Gammaproteobacteria bacterium]|nr:hypothetical protein [Gammaproteobacteria bacterium]